ncbi:hypothetical protein IFM89_015534 [Coptis chinensis]|uniref:Sulfite exporter TauE/SafE family protein n=1 Tax=Coptis chinensis TaxID=261450 RepID=A0A835IYC9_9MAGN|nr:hypothetical protein IFM89_015534 [Coptis chinensis]
MALQVAAILGDALCALEICRRAAKLADYRLNKFPSIQESASAARDFLHKNMESDKRLESNGNEEVEYKALPSGPSNGTHKETNTDGDQEVPILENVYWKEFGLLVFVWVAFLALQIAKKTLLLFDTEQDNNLFDCLLDFELNAGICSFIPTEMLLTVFSPISFMMVYIINGKRRETDTNWKVHQLILYNACGILAGVVGGVLGLGGGFILGPLFLELSIPPQVSSATTTFAMTFSSSMSVVEYYLLKRFPVPYGICIHVDAHEKVIKARVL